MICGTQIFRKYLINIKTKKLLSVSDDSRPDKTKKPTPELLYFIFCFSDHSVPTNIKQDLNTFYSNLIEILRHFWATIPPTDPERTTKHTRMIHTLQLLKQKLNGFHKSCEQESPETREQIQFILNSMLKSIQKALDKG